MKILTVVGARPQFIKAAVVSRALRNYPNIHEYIVHTGQHYDTNMSDVFFNELEIPEPDINLEIGSGLHGAQTGKMLGEIEQAILREKPDWVLVYGDTNSTLAGALGAAKLHTPIAHVEAGLRSFNTTMPEEINRVLTDHISSILFAPTDKAVNNLIDEGLKGRRIEKVGDVMFDAALFYGEKASKESSIIEKLGLTKKQYILSTFHREENTDSVENLTSIAEGLGNLGKTTEVVIVLHPRTRKKLSDCSIFEFLNKTTRILDPVGYLDMVQLERNAQIIVTDSGGIQKEAYFHRVPCITLRHETEWIELVEMGWNTLLPPRQSNQLMDLIRNMDRTVPDLSNSPYGEGNAADKISVLLN